MGWARNNSFDHNLVDSNLKAVIEIAGMGI
jgi:hypothetical protein